MKIIVFNITGAPAGLLMNNPASMTPTDVSGKVKAPAKHLQGQAEADTKVYTDEKGFLQFPAIAFRLCLIQGASGRKIGKFFAKNLVTGCVFPAERWVQLLDAKGKPTKKYEVHTEPIVNPTTKGRSLRSRPLINPWACLVPLEIDEELIAAETVLELLNLAGKTVGVGDHRPLHGRFSASLA